MVKAIGNSVLFEILFLLTFCDTTSLALFFLFMIFFFLSILFYLFIFFKFYFIFKLYNIVLVLPNIKMNPPQVYPCSPSWTLLPPPSTYWNLFQAGCQNYGSILIYYFPCKINHLITYETVYLTLLPCEWKRSCEAFSKHMFGVQTSSFHLK